MNSEEIIKAAQALVDDYFSFGHVYGSGIKTFDEKMHDLRALLPHNCNDHIGIFNGAKQCIYCRKIDTWND